MLSQVALNLNLVQFESDLDNGYYLNMARRKLSEENIRKIQKISRSYYVTIPVEIIREFGWESGQELIVEKYGKEIVILRRAAKEKNGKKHRDKRFSFRFSVKA